MKKIFTLMMMLTAIMYANTVEDMKKDYIDIQKKEMKVPSYIDQVTFIESLTALQNSNVIQFKYLIAKKDVRKYLKEVLKREPTNADVEDVYARMKAGLKKDLVNAYCEKGYLEREMVDKGMEIQSIYRNDDGVFLDFTVREENCLGI